MKFILAAVFILVSAKSFADCSIDIQASTLTQKQVKLLKSELQHKGYELVQDGRKGAYTFRIVSWPTSIFNSVWKARASLSKNDGERIEEFNSNDYALSLPFHMATLSFGTMIPTKGGFAVKKIISRIPTCGESEEVINL